MGSRMSTLRKKRDKSSPSPVLPPEIPLRLRARVAHTAHNAVLYDKATGEPIKVADAMNVPPRARPYDHKISPLAQNPALMFAERPSSQDGGLSEEWRKQPDFNNTAKRNRDRETYELDYGALGFHELAREDLVEKGEAANEDDHDTIPYVLERDHQSRLWHHCNTMSKTTGEGATLVSNPVIVNSVHAATTNMMSPTRSVYPRISTAETASVVSLDFDPQLSQFSIADTESITSWAPDDDSGIADLAISVATGRHTTLQTSATTENYGAAQAELNTLVERMDLHHPSPEHHRSDRSPKESFERGGGSSDSAPGQQDHQVYP